MMATFDYDYTLQATGQLHIEDIGNCALLCHNDSYKSYVLIIFTNRGQTKVIEFGPFLTDYVDDTLDCTCKYYTFEFKQTKIENIIDRFINDNKKLITQVEEISIEDALNYVTNLKEMLYIDTERKD